jgi:hypothetical protein
VVPYQRPEFVSSLQFPVIAAMYLFDWWRTNDMAAVVDAITGPPRQL